MPRTVPPAIAAGAMASKKQPVIDVDDGLRLRPFLRRDADDIIRAFEDPDIRHWHGYRLDSMEEAWRSIGRGHILWQLERGGNWAIVGDDDRLRGRVALYTHLEGGTGEIAYWVLPAARRQGVAARSVDALTMWGHELGVRRILLQHSVHNVGSCAVAMRCGYAFEGTARQQDVHIDGRHDMHQHSHVIGD